jgi:hypothetical protein
MKDKPAAAWPGISSRICAEYCGVPGIPVVAL